MIMMLIYKIFISCLRVLKKVCFTLTCLVICFIFTGIVPGCSTFGLKDMEQSCRIKIEYAPELATSKGKEAIWADRKLEETFCEYWTLRFEGNLEKTYALEAPLFRKQVTIDDYELYVKRTKENVLDKIVIDGAGKTNEMICFLDCDFYMKTKKEQLVQNTIRDKWIQNDGQWYHALRDPLFFPIKYE